MRAMKGLAAGILVSVACWAPLLAQERDISLERISLALKSHRQSCAALTRLRALRRRRSAFSPWFLRLDRARSFASLFQLASLFRERSQPPRRRIGDAKRQPHGARWKRLSNGSRNSSRPPSSECDRTSGNRSRMAEPDEDALSHIRKLLEGIREKVCRGDTERVSWTPPFRKRWAMPPRRPAAPGSAESRRAR